MVHSGFEASAITDAVKRPWKALKVAVAGVRTEGPIAPEIPLKNQRPAEYVFARHVQHKLAEIEKAEARTEKPVAAE
jgi:hypothetical protein